MAKSLRSKAKRAFKQIKREKWSKKESAKLKQIVDVAKKNDAAQELKDVYKVVDIPKSKPTAEQLSEEMMGDQITEQSENGENTEVETETIVPNTDLELRNKHGNYPVWMNQRAVKKDQKKRRKQKSAIKKANKKKRSSLRPWK